MFARLSAKAMLVAAAAAMVFFGIGLIGMAMATLLTQRLGVAGGYSLAGVILLVPPILWIIFLSAARPRREKPEAKNEFMTALFATLARETPWAAVAGAGLVGIANLFLNRNKNKK